MMFYLMNFSFFFTEIDIAYMNYTGKDIPANLYNMMWIMSLIIVLIFTQSRTKAVRAIEIPTVHASIMFGDKIIESTKEVVFVGQTKGYVFFYNIKSKKHYVFPTGDVKLSTFTHD